MDSTLGFDFDRMWDYENGFYLTSDPTRISKLLAHFELYKRIVGLPGAVVECGVFKGTSLIRFATFREILESRDSRKIIGFDAFGRFPDADRADDSAFVEQFEGAAGEGIPEAELIEVLKRKRFENVELVAGDIMETVPAYAADHLELRIALLHIDVDVYAPSKVTLEQLYDRVVPGGLIVLDDYATVAGETDAVEEFFADKPHRVEKLPISHIPAFIVKQ